MTKEPNFNAKTASNLKPFLASNLKPFLASTIKNESIKTTCNDSYCIPCALPKTSRSSQTSYYLHILECAAQRWPLLLTATSGTRKATATRRRHRTMWTMLIFVSIICSRHRSQPTSCNIFFNQYAVVKAHAAFFSKVRQAKQRRSKEMQPHQLSGVRNSKQPTSCNNTFVAAQPTLSPPSHDSSVEVNLAVNQLLSLLL